MTSLPRGGNICQTDLETDKKERQIWKQVKKNQYMGLHLSNEADIQMLLFKYDPNFNYAVDFDFGERECVILGDS